MNNQKPPLKFFSGGFSFAKSYKFVNIYILYFINIYDIMTIEKYVFVKVCTVMKGRKK